MSDHDGMPEARPMTWRDLARDFTGDQLDELERTISPLMGEPETRLMRLRLSDDHSRVIAQLDVLPWLSEPEAAADAALTTLIASVDPAADDADLPWALTALRLLTTPKAGTQFARRWFISLHHARFEDRAVSVVLDAIAAYTVAGYEALLGPTREYEEEIWLETAVLVTEGWDRPGLSLAVLVRAARLLQPLMERARLAPGP